MFLERRRRWVRPGAHALALGTVFLLGCGLGSGDGEARTNGGSSGGDVAGVQFEPYFPVYADTPKQRRIGRELRHYLVRNAGDESWIWKVSGIVVQRGVIAMATELRRNRYGKRVARDICRLIQGADVADFTPGHTVYGRNEIKLRTCRARPRP